MESLTSGTLAGTGSFRCEQCGYVVTLAAGDALPACPGCGGRQYARASLFGASRFARGGQPAPTEDERHALLADAKAQASDPGEYLVYSDGGQTVVVPLTREWTRVGRS